MLIGSGYSIPRFCYHGLLSIAGNCRICVIDDREFKVSVSCALCYETYRLEFYNDGILIGVLVKNSLAVRECVLEFLLLSHPLDCPICDRGGECELQDMSNSFGSDGGRTKIKKNTVMDKYFSISVTTHMSRCITCGRCVRFLREITHNFILGIVGRGNICEISNYVMSLDQSETLYIGNIIDLCPVTFFRFISTEYYFRFIIWAQLKFHGSVVKFTSNNCIYMYQCYEFRNFYMFRLYYSLPITYASRKLVDDVYECVLCASCSASCPSVWWNNNSYVGPAVLLQSYKWVICSSDSEFYNRLNTLNMGYNISLCHGIGNCKIVCPKNLDPASRITDIKSLLGFNTDILYTV